MITGQTDRHYKILNFASVPGGRLQYTDQENIDEIYGIQISDLISEGYLSFRWLSLQKTINMPFQIETTAKGLEYVEQLERFEKL